jgi:hypothetical protein
VGTRGGSHADVQGPAHQITAHGAVLGLADTTTRNAQYRNDWLYGGLEFTFHAFSYAGGRLTDLGALPGNNCSVVFEVNRRGLGVGASDTGRFDPRVKVTGVHPVLFRNGRVVDIGTLPGGSEGFAVGVNDRGQVLGISNSSRRGPGMPDFFDWHGQIRSFVWQDGTLNLVPQAWSPDGRRIAFEGWDDSDPTRTGVYTARVDGSDLRRVTARAGGPHDIPLDFSPDGRHLVLYRSVHTDPDPATGGSLWVADVDGGDAHAVTGTADPSAPWARWSPDGRTILFATERLQRIGLVQTVRPDGTHRRVLLRGTADRFPITPDWSPDGSHIALAIDPTNDESRTRSTVCTS